MTWVRIDDTTPELPEWDAAGAEALALHVAGLAYCNRQLTDSTLPRARARRLLSLGDPDAVIEALVRVGFWQSVDGDTLRIVGADADKQPSREDVEQRRAKDAERQQVNRERADKHRKGDHSRCYAGWCKHGELSRRDNRRDAQGDSRRDSLRPAPDSDPTPRGGEGAGESADGMCSAGAPHTRRLMDDGFTVTGGVA